MKRPPSLVCASILLCSLGPLGCGERRAAVDSGVPVDAAPSDSGGPLLDAGPGGADGGPLSDAATGPEICDNAADDDGDGLLDCADDDCWSLISCAAAQVETVVPGLTACHDPIERSADDEDAACALVGTPMGSMYTTACGTDVRITATIRFFCDTAMQVKAAWIWERATLPRTSRMLGPRQFEQTYYEYENILDWEHITSGASGYSGSGPIPVHRTGAIDGLGLLTVRPIEPGSTVERLLGLQHITSLIDLDMSMSMDTRSALRVGATTFAVPP